MVATVQSVERAAALLRLLASQVEPVPLGQLASSLGLAKGTAHGLLRTLHEVGFVDHVPGSGSYQLGAELLALGSSALDTNELRSSTLNWVDTLAARTGEEARIAALQHGEAVVAHHVFRAGPEPQSLHTGQVLPLHATALGKVLLAFDPRAARSIAGGELESLTFRTVTERSALARAVADVRDRGWAAALEEAEPGRAGIAAPVRDRSGFVVAAVGIDGPMERLCDTRLAPQRRLVDDVLAIARSISRALGHGRER